MSKIEDGGPAKVVMVRTFYDPPECWSSCTDPFCHYTHHGTWSAEGVPGDFDTQEEAVNAALAARKTEASS